MSFDTTMSLLLVLAALILACILAWIGVHYFYGRDKTPSPRTKAPLARGKAILNTSIFGPCTVDEAELLSERMARLFLTDSTSSSRTLDLDLREIWPVNVVQALVGPGNSQWEVRYARTRDKDLGERKEASAQLVEIAKDAKREAEDAEGAKNLEKAQSSEKVRDMADIALRFSKAQQQPQYGSGARR